jgi:cell division protein FtsZ
MIQFDLPKEQSSILKVIGVGGGGSNAVNHMHAQLIEGVDFIICNTDAQAIANSKVPNKIQLGPHLTQGLGAGANPEIGRQATEESLEEIRKILEVNTKMAFITAGMGGGTGTGGAPIIAKICKDLGILTVGIVTTPFGYEGKKRFQQALKGIDQLKQHVDTLLVISNDKLRTQFRNLKASEAFIKADNVLATAAKCITDVITSTGQINVDFADVSTVMRDGGVAILGSATAGGQNRAQIAIEEALNSPLLNNNDIRGAKWILININSAEGEFERTMDEVETIQNYLFEKAGEDTDVILGMGFDNTLGEKISVTLIATGFQEIPALAEPVKKPETSVAVTQPKSESVSNNEPEKIILSLQPAEESKTYAPVLLFSEEEEIHTSVQQENSNLPIDQNRQTTTDTVFDMPVVSEITETVESESAFDEPVIQFVLENKQENEIESFAVSNVDTAEQVVESSVTKEEPKVMPGFLTKPAIIYQEVDETLDVVEVKQEIPPVIENKSTAVESVVHFFTDEDLEITEMELVEKEEETDSIKYIQSEFQEDETDKSEAVENIRPSVITDESEEQRKKAEERLHKLRNLSYNYNAADPNNEFETVPAYIRKNLELYNTISPAENFYSNYSVQQDDENKVRINGLNSFLEGKRPD